MNDHGWWWHLLNDPMSDNPWSLLAMILMLPVLLVLAVVTGRILTAVVDRLTRSR